MPSDDPTRTKTLWSETQFELLYAAFDKDRSDDQVREILRDLVSRDFPSAYLQDKVKSKCGMMAGSRCQKIIAGMKKKNA